MPGSIRVLFVSKPIAPPWHDGSKNLVRDVAAHLSRATPTVLSTPAAPSIGPRVASDPIYRGSGRFAPGLVANARVLTRLVTGDAQDVWHFAFAPNPASSTAARVAITARRLLGWRGKVVQTIASAPRRFEGVRDLLFGDVVVVLSEWTRARMVGAGVAASKLRVIGPCAAPPPAPSAVSVASARERYRLGAGPVVLYPGDYEVSTGARTFAAAIKALAPRTDAVFVYACREKTGRAAGARKAVAADLALAGLEGRVRHVGEIDDLPALIAASSVVAFPVDDLYGKVDIPLVLLEALSLGVPMVLAHGGPLETVASARFAPPADGAALASALGALLGSDDERARQVSRGKELYASHFAPQVIADRYDALYEEVIREQP